MKQYEINFKDGHKLTIWASNPHNAKNIAIGICARSSGKSQDEIASQIDFLKEI